MEASVEAPTRAASRRQRKRQARRREMLEVAMKIVAEQGLDGLTIARLANALDAAVGGLYRYFPSKDDLLVALQVQALDDFLEDLQESMEEAAVRAEACDCKNPRASALMRIMLVMQFYMDDAILTPERHGLIYAFISALDPFLSKEGAVEGGKVVDKVLSEVKKDVGIAVGDDFSEDELAQWTHVLWATLHGLDHFRKRDRIQKESLTTASLLPIAQRSLFLGWGIESKLIDEAFVCFGKVYQPPLTETNQ